MELPDELTWGNVMVFIGNAISISAVMVAAFYCMTIYSQINTNKTEACHTPRPSLVTQQDIQVR